VVEGLMDGWRPLFRRLSYLKDTYKSKQALSLLPIHFLRIRRSPHPFPLRGRARQLREVKNRDLIERRVLRDGTQASAQLGRSLDGPGLDPQPLALLRSASDGFRLPSSSVPARLDLDLRAAGYGQPTDTWQRLDSILRPPQGRPHPDVVSLAGDIVRIQPCNQLVLGATPACAGIRELPDRRPPRGVQREHASTPTGTLPPDRVGGAVFFDSGRAWTAPAKVPRARAAEQRRSSACAF